MRTGALIATAAGSLLVVSAPVHAQSEERMLMYSYQQDGLVVHIAFVDLPSGPVCHINDPRGLPRTARDFAISKKEFNDMWSALNSSQIEQFESGKNNSSGLDALNYYVFNTAFMPAGKNRIFRVPKNRAPTQLVDLVRAIRAYNRD